MKTATVLAFGCVLAAAPLRAQAAPPPPAGPGDTNTVVGFVTDKATGLAIQAANVFVPGLRVSTATDATGFFTARKMSGGKVVLVTRAGGYVSWRDSITVRPGVIDTLTIEMVKPK